MKSTKSKKRNLAIPGEPLTQAEFEALIKEAEKGPFYGVEEFRKKFDKWKKQLKK